MKRISRVRLAAVLALVCAYGAAIWSHPKPLHAQQNTGETDTGSFYISAYIDVDGGYNVYGTSVVQTDDYTESEYVGGDGYISQDASYIAYDSDSGYDYLQFSFSADGPVTPGHYYGVQTDGYECGDDGEDEDCDVEYVASAYASVYVPLPPEITNLSTYTANQGDQATLTITGANFIQNDSDQLTLNFISTYYDPFTLTSTPSTCTSPCIATFSYDLTGYPPGQYGISVSNNEGTSSPVVPFTVTYSPSSNPPAAPPNPCDLSSPQVGFTSIVLAGLRGGSGTIGVSFTGAAFAAVSPNVAYGPYSTPNSIAASIAALITKKYLQSGLSAKAFGPNIVYNGLSTLGTVSTPITGSTFGTDLSSSAGRVAEAACDAEPQAPTSNTEIAVVAWINQDLVGLPPNSNYKLQEDFPKAGPGPLSYPMCVTELMTLASGDLGDASDTAADKDYVSAWLLKYSANKDPGAAIYPATFTSFNFQYRLFADFSPGGGIHSTSIGYTPDPCGTPFVYLQGDTYAQNGHTGTSLLGYQYLLAETRVGPKGQNGWKTLHDQHEIPWVWSVIEFDQNASPVRFDIKSTVPCLGGAVSVNYQIFPTYSVYKKSPGATVATLFKTIAQGNFLDFSYLPPGQSLDESCIQ